MICTEENRKTCREEKLGCEGCFYNEKNKEIEKNEKEKERTKDDM